VPFVAAFTVLEPASEDWTGLCQQRVIDISQHCCLTVTGQDLEGCFARRAFAEEVEVVHIDVRQQGDDDGGRIWRVWINIRLGHGIRMRKLISVELFGCDVEA
jgi:hypothetical protein